MENTPFGVQLEFLEFEKLTDNTSKLNMHISFSIGCTQKPIASDCHLPMALIWHITDWKKL